VHNGEAAREITYAFNARTRAGRAVIRSIENLTGRPRLIKMALGYEQDVARGRDFWEVMQERYRLRIALDEASLARIPRTGPVVVVANHPFGILDGLALGRILSATRGEFRIMAHQVFHKAKDLADIILPITFDETKEGLRSNLETRQEALPWLGNGGAIGIFPGGTVSTSQTWWSRPMDPPWKTFTAKMITRSQATVVPVYFDGHNSRLWQIASHLNYTLRTALLISEFGDRVGGEVRVRIGEPIPHAELAPFRGDGKALMDHLRIATYKLADTPLPDYSYGKYLG
jgi:putative hemolysin